MPVRDPQIGERWILNTATRVIAAQDTPAVALILARSDTNVTIMQFGATPDRHWIIPLEEFFFWYSYLAQLTGRQFRSNTGDTLVVVDRDDGSTITIRRADNDDRATTISYQLHNFLDRFIIEDVVRATTPFGDVTLEVPREIRDQIQRGQVHGVSMGTSVQMQLCPICFEPHEPGQCTTLQVSAFRDDPPPEPSEGVTYIVSGNPSGAWYDHPDDIVTFWRGAWSFTQPRLGQRARINELGIVCRYTALGWVALDGAEIVMAYNGETNRFEETPIEHPPGAAPFTQVPLVGFQRVAPPQPTVEPRDIFDRLMDDDD
jgi:hypothetical protein